MSFIYPSLLRPTTTEVLITTGQALAIPKIELQLRRWAGPPISNTFGNKPLIDFRGHPVFAELCVYELFRLSGWEARWVETYGAGAMTPKHLTAWADAGIAGQRHEPINSPAIQDLLQKIAHANGNSYAGCWDVVGWNGESVVFAELKRRKKDRIRPTQPRWLEAGLQVDLTPESFLLVEWDTLNE